MHMENDYIMKRLADSRVRDLHSQAQRLRLIRKIRMRRRRQLMLWICYWLKRIGHRLVSLGEKIEGIRASELVPSGSG